MQDPLSSRAASSTGRIESRTANPPNQTLTIAQLALSGLGMVFALLAAIVLGLFGLVGQFGESMGREEVTAILGLAWVSLLVAFLAVPSLYLSIQRLRGRDSRLPRLNGFRLASLMLLLWPLALAAGTFLTGSAAAWLLLPPLQLLAFGLPIWWLVELARRNLPHGSPQRSWGLLNGSMFLTTPLVIFLELIVLGMLFGAFVAWLSTQPALIRELEALSTDLLNAADNPEEIIAMARPYLQNPLTVLTALAILGGLMPMLEELFKPLVMWALLRRRITPAEGFVAGAVCGAAFALLESLLNLSAPAQDGWALLAVGRSGTALLHITTTALIGWALASAWSERLAWHQLVLTYLFSVALHGLWNVLSVMSGFTAIFDNPPDNMRLFELLSVVAPYGIVILVMILFVLLWGFNRRLRRETRPSEPNSNPERSRQAYHLESTIHGNDPRSH